MLIIPEIRCVVIQPPRTGSTSLKRAVLDRYPGAFSPYRHMEREGIPLGYEAFDVVGIVRHPVARLMSLYSYMGRFRSSKGDASTAWVERMARDVDRPFGEWLRDSTEVFTDPVDLDGVYQPYYTVLHRGPIARRSQFLWHRPDLGPIELLRLEMSEEIEARLGVKLPHLNESTGNDPEICDLARAVISEAHGWDLSLYARAC